MLNAGRLPIRQRALARAAARRAWMEAEGSGDDAMLIFEQDPRIVDLDPATIAILIKIAIMLFEFWLKNNVSEPSVVADTSEPLDVWTEEADAD
jgi:hypothetical protein